MKSGKPRRIYFIDELRGLSILLMVLYHAAYDIIYIFGYDIFFFHWRIIKVAQPAVAGLFILLSGISCRFSRSNTKRGMKALALGLLMTAVTMIFMREQAIYFGILHFMGSAMLLFALFKPALDALPPFAGMTVSAVLFAITYKLPEGYIGFEGLYKIALPISWYDKHYLLPIGFGGLGSDYFPLLPWLFLYFAGTYIGVFFMKGRCPAWFYRTHSKALSRIGRHTIVIYLLHQPVIMGLLWVFFYILQMFRQWI